MVNEQEKQLTPIKGKALVYIVRPGGFFGAAIGFNTFCNDEYIGKTKGNNFLYLDLEPGHYIFTAKSENTDSLRIELHPDETYFIHQKVRMGFLVARVKLELIDEIKGRNALRKCKLPKNR